MTDEVIRTIDGNDDAWTGERMSPEEVDHGVAILEEWIVDLRSQVLRGFAIAGVGSSGVGSVYRINRFIGAGASRPGMVGAVTLLSHRLAGEINDDE